MNRAIRLTAVLTHPVQYGAPWFRHVAARCPELDLTVLYAAVPDSHQQGAGFGVPFAWDTPLTGGYRARVLRPARRAERLGSEHFWGLDVPEIASALVETRPDVALVPGWHSITLVRALLACRWARIPVLYRGDTNLDSAPSGWRSPLWRAAARLRLRLFDGYLCVGTRAREFLARFGASPCRVFAAPHAVDNDFFAAAAAPHQTDEGRRAARVALGLPPDDWVALFVGKLEAKKRPFDLVEAVARLAPSASLLVVGAGELAPACQARARALGLRAAWAGFLNQTELGRAYAAADCLVLPSERETWGLVVNEAMATGLPCVVSDGVGSAPDLVTSETGAVFATGDVTGLGLAMARVRARQAQGRDFGPACRARAAAHGLDRAAAGLVAACRSLARERDGRGGGGRASAVATEGAPRAMGDVGDALRVIACCGAMVAISGLERMVFELLEVLRERGARIHCVVNPWGSERVVPLVRALGAGCSTGRYRRRFERPPANPIRLAAMAADAVRTSAGLLRDARRFRPTHVLVPDFVTVVRNAPALAVLRLTGVRVIFQMANAPEPGSFHRRVWRWGVAPFVDRFVCNSAFTRYQLLAHGIAPAAVALIAPCPPGRADTAPLGARDATRVIYVGQVIPDKGLDLLLDAIALLRASGRDARLDVVGEMDGWEAPAWRGYRARLQARAEQPDLAGRVRFLGVREDVPALLSRAAVHCCPSRPEIREGFGLVVVEAKEAGIPSVVCPSGALPELVEHGVDGWICSEASAGAIAEGIEFFMKDADRLAGAGRAARQSAARFSRQQFTRHWWAEFASEPPQRVESPC